MGGFSPLHWIIVLLFFSPIIIGIAVMGLQKKIVVKHTVWFAEKWLYWLLLDIRIIWRFRSNF